MAKQWLIEILDENGNTIYEEYFSHFSKIVCQEQANWLLHKTVGGVRYIIRDTVEI